MANYRRFLIYRRNTLVAQTQFVGKSLEILYDLQGLVGNDLAMLYDILTVDARSLWEPKQPGQALWEAPPGKNPTSRPTVSTSDTVEGNPVLDELGGFILDEAGGYILAE